MTYRAADPYNMSHAITAVLDDAPVVAAAGNLVRIDFGRLVLMNRELYGLRDVTLPAVIHSTAMATDGTDLMYTIPTVDGIRLGDTTFPTRAKGSPALVWSGDRYWLLWNDASSRAYVAPVDRSGTPGAPVSLGLIGDSDVVTLAADGSGGALVYGTVAIHVAAGGETTTNALAIPAGGTPVLIGTFPGHTARLARMDGAVVVLYDAFEDLQLHAWKRVVAASPFTLSWGHI